MYFIDAVVDIRLPAHLRQYAETSLHLRWSTDSESRSTHPDWFHCWSDRKMPRKTPGDQESQSTETIVGSSPVSSSFIPYMLGLDFSIDKCLVISHYNSVMFASVIANVLDFICWVLFMSVSFQSLRWILWYVCACFC